MLLITDCLLVFVYNFHILSGKFECLLVSHSIVFSNKFQMFIIKFIYLKFYKVIVEFCKVIVDFRKVIVEFHKVIVEQSVNHGTGVDRCPTTSLSSTSGREIYPQGEERFNCSSSR